MRARLEVSPAITAADLEALALADEGVVAAIGGREVRRCAVETVGAADIVRSYKESTPEQQASLVVEEVAFDLPFGRTSEEEVTLRRHLARQVVTILTEAEALKGDDRAAFVRERMEALQQDVLARRQA